MSNRIVAVPFTIIGTVYVPINEELTPLDVENEIYGKDAAEVCEESFSCDISPDEAIIVKSIPMGARLFDCFNVGKEPK